MRRTPGPTPRRRDAAGTSDATRTLYGAPLNEFVRVRATLARQLRVDRDPDGAKTILAAPKPSASAWALNQVARADAEGLRTLVRLRHAAARSQSTGHSSLHESIAAYRAQLDALVKAAHDRLVDARRATPASLLREIRETLEAAAQDPDRAGAELLRGHLVRALHVENAFDGLTASARGHLRVVDSPETPPRRPPAPPRPVIPRSAAVRSAPARPVRKELAPAGPARADAAASRALEKLRGRAVAALDAAKVKETAARARLEAADASLRQAGEAVQAAAADLERATRARDSLAGK